MTESIKRARSIFEDAIANHPKEHWNELLNRQCADDHELRRRVEQLLSAHVEMGSIQRDDSSESHWTIDESISEKPGDFLGPYKLLQQIGEGGMGVVYMAEQTEPVKRRVALKIIKPGMDTRAVVARFEAERQALAMMDHPNIAKVLDAGTTESSKPYFVMELVNGIPITKYCDEQHLTPKERLELFIPICQAVQHAHQKGIIHRDLKPSNILIALYDGQAVPKVIDFGVAKATSQTLTEKTLFTQLGQIVGTLEYMSPEQAERNQLDIDTRSDIYSLGVVLYELLTSETPFDRHRLRSAAFDEMLRIIRVEEPPKPSAKLSSSAALPSIAKSRQTEPNKLSALVRGELDWIVMKTLEKDRARRYETANDFANDIRRYLDYEPVVACPPSARYRLRKFVQRNKMSIGSGLVLAATLIIGLLGTTLQAVRATRARDLSHKNMTLAFQTLDRIYLGLVEEELPKHPDRMNNFRSVLKDALDFYREFAKNNSNSVTARVELAVAYGRAGVIAKLLGANDDALHHLRDAREAFANLAREGPGEPRYREKLANIYLNMGAVFQTIGQFDEALDAYDTAIGIVESFDEPYPDQAGHHDNLAVLFKNLGLAHQATGQLGAAEVSLRKSVDHALTLENSSTVPDHRGRVASCLIDLGTRLVEKGELAEGNQHFEHALRVLSQLTLEHPEVAAYDMLLATCHLNQGRLLWLRQQKQAAQKATKDAVAIAERLVHDYPLVPEYSSLLIRIYANVSGFMEPANFLTDASMLERAIDFGRQQIERHPDVPGYSFDLVLVYNNLGVDLELSHQWKDAAAMYENGQVIAKQLVQRFPQVPRYQDVNVRFLGNLADVRNKLVKASEAESAYRQAIEHGRELVESFSGEVGFQLSIADIESRFAIFLREQKRAKEAESVCQSVIERLSILVQANPSVNAAWPNLARAQLNRGNLLFDLMKFDEAEESFDLAEATLKSINTSELDSAVVLEGLAHVNHCRGDLRASRGQYVEAEEAYREAITLQAGLVTDHPENPKYASKLAMIRELLFNLLNKLGVSSYQLEQYEDAEQALLRAAQQADELHNQFPEDATYQEYQFRIWNNIVAVTQKSRNETLQKKALENVLIFEPENALALNALAWLMLTANDASVRDTSKALEWARRAVELEPNDVDYIATLGAAEYRAGNLQNGVDRLKQSLEMRAEDSVVGAYDCFFLAMAQSRLGNATEAQQSFERGEKLLQKSTENDAQHRQPLQELQNEAAKQLAENSDSNNNSAQSTHNARTTGRVSDCRKTPLTRPQSQARVARSARNWQTAFLILSLSGPIHDRRLV